MAALSDDELMRAIDITVESVLRRTRGLPVAEQNAAMSEAMRELLNPRPRQAEPRQWDSADISYDHQEPPR